MHQDNQKKKQDDGKPVVLEEITDNEALIP
jgi:hypothetical protein